MSPSAQLTLEQLKEIIEHKKMTDQGAGEVQEHVDGEEVLDPYNNSPELSTVVNTINNKFDHECLGEVVRLLNAHPIHQLTDDWVPGYKYSIPGRPIKKFRAHQVWAIWFIVRRWVWDADMPGALVADEMGLGKTFTSVAVAMICKLLTERVVIGLPLTIVWGNTLAERLNMVQNNFPGIIGKERERYPLWRHNAVPCCLIEIQKTPQQGHAVLISALKCILVVTMPGDAETFKSVIDEMTYATNFKPLNLLHAEDANLTYEDLNTSLDEPENRSNIHRVPCDTSTSRAKPWSNG